jgi:CRP-like cAMP-binding protein
MFAEFETYIKEQADLSEEEIKLMHSLATEKTMRRKEFLFQQGEVCRYKIFVCKSLLRAYSTREDGSEHIIQFSAEHSWTTDPESFYNSVPSKCSIDTLEHSEVILWTRKDFGHLMTSIPALKAFSEALIGKSNIAIRQRVLSTISSTTEEKYEEFVKNYPDIFARVPLHMVASYLGVSRETLSRIRHTQLSSK